MNFVSWFRDLATFLRVAGTQFICKRKVHQTEFTTLPHKCHSYITKVMPSHKLKFWMFPLLLAVSRPPRVLHEQDHADRGHCEDGPRRPREPHALARLRRHFGCPLLHRPRRDGRHGKNGPSATLYLQKRLQNFIWKQITRVLMVV